MSSTGGAARTPNPAGGPWVFLVLHYLAGGKRLPPPQHNLGMKATAGHDHDIFRRRPGTSGPGIRLYLPATSFQNSAVGFSLMTFSPVSERSSPSRSAR